MKESIFALLLWVEKNKNWLRESDNNLTGIWHKRKDRQTKLYDVSEIISDKNSKEKVVSNLPWG